jgi:2-aminobenzoate-CoA ligase
MFHGLVRDKAPELIEGQARWAALIEENLPPRTLWPGRLYRLPSLRYPETLNLAELLLSAADPDAPAILWRGERTTYGQLRARVMGAAAALVEIGVNPSDRVALRFHDTPAFIVAWLAVQWVGAIGVPIPAIHRRREIGHALCHSGARLVVCSADLAGDVEVVAAAAPDRRIAIATGLESRRSAPLPYAMRRDWPALITYITSAAGSVRGVVHSPMDLLCTADTYAREVLNLSAGDVCLGLASMAWSYGLGASLVFPLRAGAATALVEKQGPSLPVVIASTRATLLFLVPTAYRLLVRQSDLESYDLSSVRCCVSAAEPLPAAVASEWRRRTGLEILDGLGTTELAHIFVSNRPGRARPGSIGAALAGYDVRVIGEDSRELARGTPGLLAVRGPTGARYWRDTCAQQDAIRDGWTLTGDIAVCEADGTFTYVRRGDDLIVSGGHKISPREVEGVLLEDPAVQAAHVYGVSDSTRGALPHADVTLRAGAEVPGAVERLQQYLRQELAPYKCPRTIRVVKSDE